MYTVHVYTYDGVKERKFNDLDEAKKYARSCFRGNDVYKVKVWKGKTTPNVDKAENLLLHLV